MPEALGAAYVEMPDFDGPAEFLASLRQAVVVGHHFDRPRPWTAAHRAVHRRPAEPSRPMSILHAIVLGIVQGLTEFLPISSSGHLILVPWVLGWDDFDGDKSLAKTFDVALHIGTLVAVVAYFWTDLKIYARDGIRKALHPRRAGHPRGSPGVAAAPVGRAGGCRRRAVRGQHRRPSSAPSRSSRSR